jgi:hypothetical protein
MHDAIATLLTMHVQGLRHSVWPVDGHAFPKLRLK